MNKLRSWILIGACVAITACGSDDDTPPSSEDPGDVPADASEECAPGTPEFTYGPTGLSQTDPTGQFTVQIVDASDAPPTKNFNDWTIQINDGTGAPMPQAHLTWACAWMPAHRHGSNPKAIMKQDAGKYTLTDQNFAMYGSWQVQLWVDPAGAVPDFAPGTTAGAVGPNACSPTAAGVAGQNPNVEFSICIPRQRGSS